MPLLIPFSRQSRVALVSGLFLVLANAAALGAPTRSGDRLQVGSTPATIPWEHRNGSWEMADTAAWQYLGLELQATETPNVQPVHWFGEVLSLPAREGNGRRYLTLDPLIAQTGGTWGATRDRVATFAAAPTQIQDIRMARQDWGWRFVLELNRPTFWQQQVARKTATIDLPATLTPEASTAIAKLAAATAAASGDNPSPELTTTPSVSGTQLALNIPAGLGLRASTLANPPRLVLDLREDPLVERAIQWRAGIRWQQRYVGLDGDRFAVTWLELDPGQIKALRPFWAGEQLPETPVQLPGLATLGTMARQRGLSAAINGGYFNRNNKFPLGALRRDGTWLSSPILNRGAIAWRDPSTLWFGRGQFHEVFQVGDRRWPGIFLNSGYVQAGLARYTSSWGTTYVPASDGETLAIVRGDRVAQRLAAGPAGSRPVSIPRDGYLLAIRKTPELAAAFTPGARVTIAQGTTPAELDDFPNVVGAGPLLLQDGRSVLDAAAESFSPAFIRQAAPRSAIARNARGQLLLVAFGPRTGGKGPTLDEAARVLQALGATDALNLDGGSSASLYLGGTLVNRPPATAARVHNGLGF